MKFNGYTLKAVKSMATMDGFAYSGNIYFEGKKIGMACNNGFGGTTDVCFMPGIADCATHDEALTEDVVERLFTLHYYEKIFKLNAKDYPGAGTAFVTFADRFDIKNYIVGPNQTVDSLAAWLHKTKPDWEIESIELFRSLDDFNIDEAQQQEMADGGPDFADDPGEDAGGMTMTMQ